MNIPTTSPDQQNLLQQLFRSEFAKLVAVLSRQFGLQHIELAEDLVSETFLQATQRWAEKGLPDNPAAWLYTVAKQKTLYHFRRHKIYTGKVLPAVKGSMAFSESMNDLDFSKQHVQESQLQMMFAVCDPVIASEAQIGLALRILCGFGIDEIAAAFFTNKETINKRLFRAKEKLRTENVSLELPAATEIPVRLDAVLHIIYLLFNEGYHSATHDQALRRDLCVDALRLGILLTDYPLTNLPKTNALLALMCFHMSRFDARQQGDNDMILYQQQDASLWNTELIAQGIHYMSAAASGEALSAYHLEAGIAFWHCQQEDTREKWEHILYYYDLLILRNYSPGVALNRIYALYKVSGAETALVAAEELAFTGNRYYYVLLAELHGATDPVSAVGYLRKAVELAKGAGERAVLEERIAGFGDAGR